MAAAAFRRLCVETGSCGFLSKNQYQPPSGGCVLKPQKSRNKTATFPAAFRRLCVETSLQSFPLYGLTSRLQAAVC